MNETAYLVLSDGSVFEGLSFGSEKSTYGEVVFNTSMTGYQEILTDPSYSGQIVIPTYPIIGNYGINEKSNESNKIQVSGFVVRQYCESPSHPTSTSNINDFLASQNIPGIHEIDTRAIVRKLRSSGVMMGAIAIGISPDEALEQIQSSQAYNLTNFVQRVSTKKQYSWPKKEETPDNEKSLLNILVSDYGVKYNILRILESKGCRVTVFPYDTTAEELLNLNPDGIMLSPGPGDPEMLDNTTKIAKELVGKVPIMGICLGNQILAKAFGAKTYKLHFGHRGGNHPVKDLETGRIYITAQNHGYAVDAESLPPEIAITHINMNDGTVAGIKHRSLPAMSIQYHSEASPGPQDNEYIFDQFIEMVKEFK
tara:strand:- start:2983 stop:4086 length:1104 start_codon:yes stop_codon:yes gene_type:complete